LNRGCKDNCGLLGRLKGQPCPCSDLFGQPCLENVCTPTCMTNNPNNWIKSPFEDHSPNIGGGELAAAATAAEMNTQGLLVKVTSSCALMHMSVLQSLTKEQLDVRYKLACAERWYSQCKYQEEDKCTTLRCASLLQPHRVW
jgi:hypothetical protein